MKTTTNYAMMDAARNAGLFAGTAMRMMAANPFLMPAHNPAARYLDAFGTVMHRSCSSMAKQPEWNLGKIRDASGKERDAIREEVLTMPFGTLVRFSLKGAKRPARKVLLAAPMSGHFATLLRATAKSLLPHADLYVTEWRNARDIPMSEGKFDIEDYAFYLVRYLEEIGAGAHVIAVCQPVPLVMAATTWLTETKSDCVPASLVLMGGPVDPEAAPTDVSDFGHKVAIEQLEMVSVQRVGPGNAGEGRLVYPGALQLQSFMSMNAHKHTSAFLEQVRNLVEGDEEAAEKHDRFYDEYLAVMDMTGEFYLSTVERIYKSREIARNSFRMGGRTLDFGKVKDTAIMVVEGEKDDIAAPGQCAAALSLFSGVEAGRKKLHVEPGAGHYGIFAGKAWRENILSAVLSFQDALKPTPKPRRAAAPKAAPAEATPSKAAAAKPARTSSVSAKPAQVKTIPVKTAPSKPATPAPGAKGRSAKRPSPFEGKP